MVGVLWPRIESRGRGLVKAAGELLLGAVVGVALVRRRRMVGRGLMRRVGRVLGLDRRIIVGVVVACTGRRRMIRGVVRLV